MAGGMGYRLRPITEAIPKPLVPIGEKAMIEIQIDSLKKHGFDEIYVLTNYKADYISKFLGDGSRYGVKLHIYEEHMILGTAGPLNLVKEKISSPFLVINTDIITDMNFGAFFDYACKEEATMAIGVKKMYISSPYGNIYSNDNKVVALKEKEQIEVNAMGGIYIINPEVFKFIPENTMYGMDQLVNKLLEMKKSVLTYNIDGYWMDIGEYDKYEKAQQDYLKIKEHNME